MGHGGRVASRWFGLAAGRVDSGNGYHLEPGWQGINDVGEFWEGERVYAVASVGSAKERKESGILADLHESAIAWQKADGCEVKRYELDFP